MSRFPNELDLSGNYNWLTDPKVAEGGYFDDLACHGIGLFTFLLGDIEEVYGISLNQQQLYSAKDAFAACWLHEGNITGTGSWKFGCDRVEHRVGNMKRQLLGDNYVHPSNGLTATHTSWIMDKILGR